MKNILKLLCAFSFLFILNINASVLDNNWAVTAGLKDEYNSTNLVDNITSIKFSKDSHACFGTMFDVSKDKDNSIILCIKDNTLEFISSDVIEFPKDSSYLFASFSKSAIDFNNSVTTKNVENMAHMFENFATDATSLDLDLSIFDTSKVTDMSSMFQNMCNSCNSVSLDLTSFNTSKITTMQKMFSKYGYNADSVVIEGLKNFDTSNVTNMAAMFYYAGANADNINLDLTNFNTTNVTNFSEMFRSSSVNYLDLSNFDTTTGTSLNSMFYGASKLVYLDMSNFTIIGSAENMFNNNYYLQVIKFGPLNYEKARIDLEEPSSTYLPGTTNKWYNENGDAFNSNDLVDKTYYAYIPYKVNYYENGVLLKTDYKAKDLDYLINISKDSKPFNVTIKFDTDGGNIIDDLVFHNRVDYILKEISQDKTLYNPLDVYTLNSDINFEVSFEEQTIYEELELPKAEKEGYTFLKWDNDDFVPSLDQTLKAIYEIPNPNTDDSIWSIVGACSFLAILLVGMIILIRKFKD